MPMYLEHCATVDTCRAALGRCLWCLSSRRSMQAKQLDCKVGMQVGMHPLLLSWYVFCYALPLSPLPYFLSHLCRQVQGPLQLQE
jgi:hypothetical protein